MNLPVNILTQTGRQAMPWAVAKKYLFISKSIINSTSLVHNFSKIISGTVSAINN
jgi:hypothetical protein